MAGHLTCIHHGTGMDGGIKAHQLVMEAMSPEPPVGWVGQQCAIVEVLQFGYGPEYSLNVLCFEVHVPLVAGGHLDEVQSMRVGCCLGESRVLV